MILVGLPGPTHNYGGLSGDNVASSLNRGSVSSPKQAALQALELVRLLRSLGVVAAVLPPQIRPHLPVLREHFSGSDDEVIREAARQKPALLEKMTSSSAMWTANAATVTAASDSTGGKLHLTVANLHTNLHRRIEAADTHRVLSAIFKTVPHAQVHAPLDAGRGVRDEGAANHMRLAPNHSASGLNVYVYGADGSKDDPPTARQTLSAFQEITRQHEVPAERALFIKQHPDVIRSGVFHNDVIAVSNGNVLLAHESAYAGGMADIQRISDHYQRLTGESLHALVISRAQLEVEEAVHTYFFNSQIITRPDGGMTVIAPTETRDLYAGKAARVMESLARGSDNPIDDIRFADLRQSMNNGGGPACLRLRVVMDEVQIAAIKASVNVLADDALLSGLEEIITSQYPAELEPQMLGNPELYHRCRAILARMSSLMKLPLV